MLKSMAVGPNRQESWGLGFKILYFFVPVEENLLLYSTFSGINFNSCLGEIRPPSNSVSTLLSPISKDDQMLCLFNFTKYTGPLQTSCVPAAGSDLSRQWQLAWLFRNFGVWLLLECRVQKCHSCLLMSVGV
ncbi:hypothetical protein AMECASPLE_039129 [Ameca splendens]|uniref:Uncharacterized protein n=1 Tax=Ameca splendens TaxID=208324 RepID=A0ABV0Y8A5_9TELE